MCEQDYMVEEGCIVCGESFQVDIRKPHKNVCSFECSKKLSRIKPLINISY
jgi:hypothetical protein